MQKYVHSEAQKPDKKKNMKCNFFPIIPGESNLASPAMLMDDPLAASFCNQIR